MNVNQHYAALLGLGEEWTVTNVALDVGGRRIDIYVGYAKKSAICPECGELWPASTTSLRSGVGDIWTRCSS